MIHNLYLVAVTTMPTRPEPGTTEPDEPVEPFEPITVRTFFPDRKSAEAHMKETDGNLYTCELELVGATRKAICELLNGPPPSNYRLVGGSVEVPR